VANQATLYSLGCRKTRSNHSDTQPKKSIDTMKGFIYQTLVNYIIVAVTLVGFTSVSIGQDVQFSQYLAVPQYLNPALTGNIDGKYRVVAGYRDQNRSLQTPLTTFGFGGDVKFELPSSNGIRSGDAFGVGVFFFTDQANAFELNTNSISLNLAYHKRLSKRSNNYISAGVLIGVQQRNINYDNLDFGDEFNQVDAFDQVSAEVLPPNNFGYADIGIGLTYSSQPTETTKIFLGTALHHATQPTLSFFSYSQFIDPSTEVDFQLYSKFSALASVDFKVANFTSLSPRLIYIKQGNSGQIAAGTYIKFTFVQSNTALYTGAWLRFVNDSSGFAPRYFVPTVGFELGSFKFGLNYDLNLLQVTGSSSNLNALEFTMQFIGSFENDDYFCPSF